MNSLFIGVSFVATWLVLWLTSSLLHSSFKKKNNIRSMFAINRGDEEYLYVNGVNIKTGDYFQFYHSDSNFALSSSSDAYVNLKSLKKEVFGGLIFACCGRGESFFGRCNVDSFPLLENFPRVPLAGIFCCGEIGRGPSSLIGESYKEKSAHCCMHVFSTVYLAMSYTSACPEC